MPKKTCIPRQSLTAASKLLQNYQVVGTKI